MTTAKRHYLLALTLALAAVLIRFPPGLCTFYPQCPIFALTGLQCPGCGATRALAALLRGHLTMAVRYNALIVGVVPFLLGYMALHFNDAQRSDSNCWPKLPGWALPAAFAVTTVFSVGRNFSHLHP